MSEMRNISTDVERLLWGISAGRCEFEGCNKVLYQHELTGNYVNLAQKAHIYAVNKGGARFQPDTEGFKNSFSNLMLVCPQCHILIDRNEQEYSPEVLFIMKQNHEKRINTLSSIGPELQSHMVFYTANIAGTHLSVNDGDARNALVNIGRYPTDQSPIDLSQYGSYLEDSDEDYYTYNERNLRRAFKERVLDVLVNGSSIAVFSLAPQPLLMLLGLLVNDKYNVLVFQCHRRENDKWRWGEQEKIIDFELQVVNDNVSASKIALVFSLSSKISLTRVKAILGEESAIYVITTDLPDRNIVTSQTIMDNFVAKSRETMEMIKQRHGRGAEVCIFPAMPASLAIRFGMDYMSKTDNKLLIYDEQAQGGFVYTLTIGDCDD